MRTTAVPSAGDHRADDAPIWFYYPYDVPEHATPDELLGFRGEAAGHFVWTVKTYAQLRRIGLPCRLTARMPSEGVVLMHRASMPNNLEPSARQLFVCMVAEYNRHPFAQLHVVQNPRDPMLRRPSAGWPAWFMPHWPEYALQPRDAARGDAFSNVAYFGDAERLAPQLRSGDFAQRLHDAGFDFRIVERDRWNDYRDIDAVLAVRSFAPLSFDKFPPSKLYNSWLAGVPALLGRESAYQAMRRSPLDYAEVGSGAEIIDTLQRLRDDVQLRREMVANGARRASELEPTRLAQRWARFLTQTAVPAYHQWREHAAEGRQRFVVQRELRYTGYVAADVVRRGTGYLRKRWWAVAAG